MKKQVLTLLAGMVLGMTLLSGGHAAANTVLTARPTTQTFYLDGQKIDLTAYLIGGSNYVRLRDIGRAADFGVEYDASTNSVYIDPTSPYESEATVPVQATSAPAALTEENVRAAIQALRNIYPTGTLYGAPYVPNNPFNRPYSNCDHCAGWAMLCSDVAFGDLPYRRITKPHWDQIRVGDLVEYDNAHGGHVVVVLEKTDDYIKVTESGSNNKTRWGGQYFKWWLEKQPDYVLQTRYPQ